MQETTIAAIATAPGAGGIAVVRLSGAESYPIAARVFRPANAAKKVEDAKGYTAMYGTFREGDEAFDEGVALFFRAPHSYTGEDVVELSCHGGSAVARRLVEACLAAGAQPAAPGEYTRRAFLNGKLGLTQAEAVMDLISAAVRVPRWPMPRWAVRWQRRSVPRRKRLPPFRLTLPHGWIFPKRMCRSWTVTICTAY